MSDLPKLAIAFCNRPRIVGADGVACIMSAGKNAASVRVYRPDGSESLLSMNGARCAARMLFSEELPAPIVISNGFGEVLASKQGDSALHLPSIAVSSPLPSFTLSGTFLSQPNVLTPGGSLLIDGQEYQGVTLVSAHLVGRSPRLREGELSRLGEKMQGDSRFPHGINISHMTKLEGASFFMATFESGGTGLVQSCSSALVCGAAMLWEEGTIATDAIVTAYSTGGVTTLSRNGDKSITATANATYVFNAELDLDLAAYFIKPVFAGSANMEEIDAFDDWFKSLGIDHLKALAES